VAGRRSAVYTPGAMRLVLVLIALVVGLRDARAEKPPRLPASGEVRSAEWWSERAPTLDPVVLDLALRAATCARRSGLAAADPRLAIIDHSMPSTARRLWVLDLDRGEVLFNELVAHGRGSGENLPVRFSNVPGSAQSSLGLFVTGETYEGHEGHSLRLHGLEEANDRAFDRAIVMHGAWYVSDAFAREHGRLGRSLGCPALDRAVASRVIDRIAGGALLFAYSPDPAWLSKSKLLGGCEGAGDGSGDGPAGKAAR